MKKLLLLAAMLFAGTLFAAEAAPENEHVFDLQDKMLEARIKLPQAAAEAGKVPVLQMTMFFRNPRPSGWTPAVMLMVDRKIINEKTAAGKKRLLRAQEGFTLNGKLQPYFKKNYWLTIYSADGSVGDKRMVAAGATDAGTFNFDLSGLVTDDAKDVELYIRCMLTIPQVKKNLPLVIRDPRIVMMSAEEVAKMRGE